MTPLPFDDIVQVRGLFSPRVWMQVSALSVKDCVKDCQWEAPCLKGVVQIGEQESLSICVDLRSLTFVRNQCECELGRRGYLCLHAALLCTYALEATKKSDKTQAQADEAIDGVETYTIAQDAASALQLHSLKISGFKGVPLRFELMLPPNWMDRIAADAIVLRVEAVVMDTKRMMPESLDSSQTYLMRAAHYRLAVLLEGMCQGSIKGHIQVNKAQLKRLLDTLKEEAAAVGVLTQGRRHYFGLKSNLLKKLYALLEPSSAKRVQKVAQPAKPAMHASRIQEPREITLDGTLEYLFVSLPSYATEIKEALRMKGFRHEPSNGRWWLRGTHKVLNFLAANRQSFIEVNAVKQGPLFKKKLDPMLSFLEVQTDITENEDGDYQLSTRLTIPQHLESDFAEALRSGCYYLRADTKVYLVDPQSLQFFENMQRSLSTDPQKSLSVGYHRPVSRAEISDINSLIKPFSNEIHTPSDWEEKSCALSNMEALQMPELSASFFQILRHYQRVGVAWLWHLYQNELCGILADEMGLGKTLQALGLLQAVHRNQNSNEKRKSSLIVCPASLVENWCREANRFVPELKVHRHHGANRITQIKDLANHDVLVTSYGTLSRDHRLFEQLHFEVIIADEAQHIKNRKTQNALALRRLFSRVRFVLTGTPIENSVNDLRSLFEFLMPGYLSSVPQNLPKEHRAWFDQRHLERASNYVIRRNKKQVAPELPEKMEQTLFCHLEPAQQSLYDQYLSRSQQHLFELEQSGASENQICMAGFTQLLRLRQICSDPRILNPNLSSRDASKFRLFKEILDEAMDDGNRILLFSQFTSSLMHIRRDLERLEIPYCYLDGQSTRRQDICDEFNQNQSIPVFLISLKAGAVGLNLTGADTVIFLDPWWNPAIEAQAIDRTHRIGQTKSVRGIRLIASHTVEEKVLQLQQDKLKDLEALFDSSQELTSKIGLKTIKSLLSIESEHSF